MLRKNQKIALEIVLDTTETCIFSQTLIDVCKQFDVSVPVVLSKHQREMEQFHRVVFIQRDFLEPFYYTCLEMTVYEQDT